MFVFLQATDCLVHKAFGILSVKSSVKRRSAAPCFLTLLLTKHR